MHTNPKVINSISAQYMANTLKNKNFNVKFLFSHPKRPQSTFTGSRSEDEAIAQNAVKVHGVNTALSLSVDASYSSGATSGGKVS